ncbi:MULTISPECIES: copper chaperone PCu(A)C [unclassified Rubrivivax]|uniref:copper chaperone PCu(A)C n=1 Tax=unclassified Rubrivivax TaxID=2649762 RepID=UPI001E63E902|nr:MULTISPECIES: copper chaperone PCu(A)C [unclassified Rubrivivax]MCC9595198.1 copper chaperone PCu(A)C [Rubrivivax sp. JA1055]MCC9648009.1 copper chaperone PCu(A)C [Rubrivivax sp. JA1029]
MNTLKTLAATAALVTASAACAAEPPAVRLDDGWARVSGPAETESEAYVAITPDAPLRLVAARSPWAAEVRVLALGGVLRLPAGRTTALAPGGPRLRLDGLRWQVRDGDVIPVSLVFEDGGGRRFVRHFGARGRAPGPMAGLSAGSVPSR